MIKIPEVLKLMKFSNGGFDVARVFRRRNLKNSTKITLGVLNIFLILCKGLQNIAVRIYQ